MQSEKSIHPSFVRFFNKTQRKVDVIWINYEGLRVKYKTLHPEESFDVNTFVSHPWIFRDSCTHEKLVVKCKDVFKPEPWFRSLARNGSQVGPQQTIPRTTVHITMPLYSLKQCSLQAIRKVLKSREDAFKLEIPQSLQDELVTPSVEEV